MSDGPLLILAATRMELADLAVGLEGEAPADLPAWPDAQRGRLDGHDVILLASGVGKASAAAGVAYAHACVGLTACINVGIAGAYVGAFVPVGAAVAAASEFDLDAGIATRTVEGTAMTPLDTVPLPRVSPFDGSPGLFDLFPTDSTWTERLAAASGTTPQPFATSDAIAGDLDVAAERADRSGAAIESMEGAGAALACAHLGVPFAAIRGVSNVAGVRDKAQWDVSTAVRAYSHALRSALRRAA